MQNIKFREIYFSFSSKVQVSTCKTKFPHKKSMKVLSSERKVKKKGQKRPILTRNNRGLEKTEEKNPNFYLKIDES